MAETNDGSYLISQRLAPALRSAGVFDCPKALRGGEKIADTKESGTG